ncbi:caspase family protein, partial [Roseateles sp. GG27B]
KSKAAIFDFAKLVKAAPADATIFFYFTGHGVQDEARNLLIGAGVNPGQLGEVQSGSLELAQDVVGPLSPRASGATYAVIDSCRVSIRSAIRDRDGLNQVEAPAGCLIAFSTAAGKPAISPAVETENTFYTASLVKVLNAAADDTSFADLFRMVRRDVRDTMLNHPIKAVRLVAQDPF